MLSVELSVLIQVREQAPSHSAVKRETTPESFRSSIQDAIAQAHLQQQLKKNEKRFQASVENLLDCFGIYSAIRDESGRIVDFRVDYVNAAACTSNFFRRTHVETDFSLDLFPQAA